jgi:ELWxxDGT repeat protein
MYLTPAEDVFYFHAEDQSAENELWKSDGTGAGTFQVKNIGIGVDSDPYYLVYGEGVLYFSAYTDTEGRELWKSDGTQAGTVMVKDIVPDFGSSAPEDLAFFDGKLYFSADDGIHGRELWQSDGTATGTMLLKDINPLGPSDPEELYATNFNLYFRADDGDYGAELWQSDGTTIGTVRITDIAAGALASSPSQFTRAGTLLYFTADDYSLYGEELWALPLDISMSNVEISGQEQGDINAAYTFQANISPLDASVPITYVWQATGFDPVTHVGGLSDSITFTWVEPGLKTVQVDLSNPVSALHAEMTITINEVEMPVYLPAVSKADE